MANLGPTEFFLDGIAIERIDFVVQRAMTAAEIETQKIKIAEQKKAEKKAAEEANDKNSNQNDNDDNDNKTSNDDKNTNTATNNKHNDKNNDNNRKSSNDKDETSNVINLQCSFFAPKDRQGKQNAVLYCHGNSGT